MLITAVAVALLAVILPGENHRYGVIAPRPPPHVIRVAGNIHKVLHTPTHGLALVPVPVRRIHVYDSKAALNLIASRELQRRRRAKGRGRPPGPKYHGGPPGPSKRRRKQPQRPRSRPTKATHHTQESHGTSPASSRVRYRTSPGPVRPPIPVYADGYTDSIEDNDAYSEDVDQKRDRDRDTHREPTRHVYSNRWPSRSKSKHPKDYEGPPKRKNQKSKTKQSGNAGSYGWGNDGGYRVPAPTYPPYTPDDTEEPGTGHLDLEERFINQHSEFYKNGYPGLKNSTRSRKRGPQYETYYESDEGISDEYENSADSSRDKPSVVRGKPKPAYSDDEEEEDTGYSIEYPVSKTRNRSTRQPENSYRPASHTTVNYVTSGPKAPNKFHAKFRKEESSGRQTIYYNDSKGKDLRNHRYEESYTTPSWQSAVTPIEVKPSTFRTRPTYPQYWG